MTRKDLVTAVAVLVLALLVIAVTGTVLIIRTYLVGGSL